MIKTEMISGISNSYSQLILDLFEPLPVGCSVVLFGSRAKGNFREGSDIDIAVRGGHFTLEDRNSWLLRYDDLYLPWKVDLVIYDQIKDPTIKAHIDRVAKVLIQR